MFVSLDSFQIDLQMESWKEMERVFGELIKNLKKSLQERNVKPKELVGCLYGSHSERVLKGRSRDDTVIFMEVKKQCEECKSHMEFWSVISDYFTFYSYDFIEQIVKSEYSTKEDRRRFNEYETQFMKYSKKIAAKYTSEVDLTKADGVTKVIIKIKNKFEKINDEHLEEFKNKLAIAIGISNLLHLTNLQPGCTLLTYRAPLVVEVAAFPLSAQQEAALVDLGVIWLSCGTYKFRSEVSIQLNVYKFLLMFMYFIRHNGNMSCSYTIIAFHLLVIDSE